MENSEPVNASSTIGIVSKEFRRHISKRRKRMAGGTGFEPVLAESESAVLPLDDPPFENGDIHT